MSRYSQTESRFVAPATAEEVWTVIRALPNKKTTAIDEISTYFVKGCSDILSDIIAHMFNVSVLCGRFPDALNKALVLHVHKKGNPYDMENYRPFALLSIFSKIIEKMMVDRISSFVDRYNIVDHFQHGFKMSYSVKTAVIDLVQHVYEKVDKNEYVLSIFFDLSRAFDTLHPYLLLEKFTRLGLRGHVSDWLLSFLSDRNLW